jgi:hypothetical protein
MMDVSGTGTEDGTIGPVPVLGGVTVAGASLPHAVSVERAAIVVVPNANIAARPNRATVVGARVSVGAREAEQNGHAFSLSRT